MSNDFIPFHKPYITEDEINEVTDTVRSGWWTTGPKAKKFEEAFNSYIGTQYSLAANSWTAAAHIALEAIGLKQGDEVIIPSITFTATAEIVCYFGAKPVIIDVDKNTFNIDPQKIEQAITSKTKAIIPVHYGGQPCDMDEINEIARNNNLFVIEDAAHALPAYYHGKKIGTLSDVTCFSFYVTKTLATGEGGMLCTNNEDIARRSSIMRLHGINSDAWKRYTAEGSWYYEVVAPGFKYNFTDIQAALGLAQLKKVDWLWKCRKEIADFYSSMLRDNPFIELYTIKNDRESSYHLFPISLNLEMLKINRSQFIDRLKETGIGSSVHFIPLYRHPFYKETFNLKTKDFPISESIYPRIITLPIWPGMQKKDTIRVVEAVNYICQKFKR
ncbi:MAG: DegT/DnrJ/EryC1/StrS family aminotransferase [Ignavibacteriaceae bacterium]|nr:DegT/DnrJ/EryC1/StrS family aminotransferase [Ignavibacteriaceae bacterium]